jgi:hypothetical protein
MSSYSNLGTPRLKPIRQIQWLIVEKSVTIDVRNTALMVVIADGSHDSGDLARGGVGDTLKAWDFRASYARNLVSYPSASQNPAASTRVS